MTIATPLTAASPTELLEATEQNLYALFQAMADVLPDSELVITDKFNRHLTFPHNPMFKGVWHTRLADNEVDQAINETIAWFKMRQAPFFFWWTGDTTTPSNLGDWLVAYGFISMEEQQHQLAHGIIQTEAGAPCMVADLQQVNESILQQTPAGFTIEEIANEQSLYDFKKVFVEVYSIPDWAGQAWVDAALRVGIGQTPWKMSDTAGICG